jgi:ABC-type multidrug transport system permease subunit
MNWQSCFEAPARRYSPFGQLTLVHLREFARSPGAVFSVYGLPILIAVALGIAFRNKPVERIEVGVQDGPLAQAVVEALAPHERFVVQVHDAPTCRLRLRTGKIELVVVPPSTSDEPSYHFSYDPTRPEGLLARNAAEDALQRAAGRQDLLTVTDHELQEPGSRYIDFLVPGLLGMGLMVGGILGVGFVAVDMRVRKLLKRFLATPMKKSHFLASILLSRLLFMVPEVLLLLVFAHLAFGVVVQGSLFAVVALILLGAFTFAGIGLLVASRARTLEAASGLMNLVMLPMWVLSGIFFSSERFPAVIQPLIKAMPLTSLTTALRNVMLEGAPLVSQTGEMVLLIAWGLGTFALALRWFRWT